MSDTLDSGQPVLNGNQYVTYETIETVKKGYGISYYAAINKLPGGWYILNVTANHAVRFADKDAIASYISDYEADHQPLEPNELIVAVEPILVHREDIR